MYETRDRIAFELRQRDSEITLQALRRSLQLNAIERGMEHLMREDMLHIGQWLEKSQRSRLR